MYTAFQQIVGQWHTPVGQITK